MIFKNFESKEVALSWGDLFCILRNISLTNLRNLNFGKRVRAEGALRRFPLLRVFNEFLFYLRPVVQIGGIEIGVIRPDQCLYFGIESHLVEKRQVAERAVNFAVQDRLEVNGLFCVVVELYPQSVRGDNLKFGNVINGMFHSEPHNYLSGSIEDGFLPPSNDVHADNKSS